MSIKISAPYNFVPLNKDVFYPSWSEQVSQDLPFSDSEDGIIDVAIHTVSPFFSRDGKDKEYSSHIMGADGKRHYFIPATTIKGMLREMIEIMSFGKMQEGKDYQNCSFLKPSRKPRRPYKYDIKQQVEFGQKANSAKADLAETLFGLVTDDNSIKGRVMVGHAFMDGIVDDSRLKKNIGILGSPKASYYPLYIRQEKSPYKTYDTPVGIAGRKLYRIHRGDSTTYLPNGKNGNMPTTFKAIPTGQTFRLRIALHNVRPMEIGAILVALTLNNTKGTFFNLGLAKGFGYGKCKVRMEDIKLSGFSCEAKHYMHEFEKQMSVFTYRKTRELWAESKYISQLASILSEHDDAAVTMMNSKAYTNSKKERKNPFNTLRESNKRINSLLLADEIKKITNV